MQVIKKLRGHSGCEVSLLKKNEKVFVRKTSNSVLYNDRLIKQFFKQINFNHQDLCSPQIFDSNFHEGLFYFDMEYIKGQQFHNYVSVNHPNNSFKILQKIFKLYKPTPYPLVSSLIKNKIQETQKACDGSWGETFDGLYDFRWENLQVSSCHGDLSLENIIIKDGEVYLIDFLDSFLDSSLIDISKILMDLILGWSWRYEGPAPLVQNTILINLLKENLTAPELEICEKLIILHLLRIIPYTQDKKSRGLIVDGLNWATSHKILS